MSSHPTIVALLLVALCTTLACPNARQSPASDSYGMESESEAIQEDMGEEAWEQSNR